MTADFLHVKNINTSYQTEFNPILSINATTTDKDELVA